MITEHERVIHGLVGCPICGREPIVKVSAGKQWRVCCEKCELSTPRTTKIEAVIRWFNLASSLRKTLGKKD